MASNTAEELPADQLNEWMEKYVKANGTILEILYLIAESGEVTPLDFACVIRFIPGYDPKKAPLLEDQWFGGDGFPLPEKPGEDE